MNHTKQLLKEFHLTGWHEGFLLHKVCHYTVQVQKKWSFEGWRDVKRVCQWNCATGPVSKRSWLSNNCACVCWLNCTRKPGTLRINSCMACLHMHNNYRCRVVCFSACPPFLFFSFNSDTMLDIESWCILAFANNVLSLLAWLVISNCRFSFHVLH